MTLPTEGTERRHYVDRIRMSYSKWVNPDPTHKMRIGTYGLLDKETGVFREEGNIYDAAFQKELDRNRVRIKMSDYPPEVGPMESDVVVCSRGTKEGDLDVDRVDVPGIADAPIKGKWTFTEGKSDAVFAMHDPHQIYLPPRTVLEPLYKVDKLMHKCLVTVVHVTDAYTFYLSDKSGGTFSMALVPKAPASGTASANGNGGFTWWADAPDAPTGLLRQACDPTGECSFMPIYRLMRPIRRIRRRFIESIKPEPSGGDLWVEEYPPWDPIDEDGAEDEFDEEVTAVDPFLIAEEAYYRRQAALAAQVAREKQLGGPE